MDLPKIDFAGTKISRLIVGGNPVTGFSHVSDELDEEFRKYYTFENCHKLLEECYKNGIDTMQCRGDRFYLRLMLEHRERGGKMKFILQTASELADHKANVREMKKYKPIAIYHHGTYVDNMFHEGKIDEIGDFVKFMKDEGVFAGIGSHIPEIIEYAEEKNWDADFYMCSLYNLAKKPKAVQAVINTAAKEEFEDSDRAEMLSVIKRVKKPCLAFKLLGASRLCSSKECLTEAFRYAYSNIKPVDAAVVGMFQKHKNQVKENAEIVKNILTL